MDFVPHGSNHKTVGLLTSFTPEIFKSEYFTRIISGIIDALRQTNHALKVAHITQIDWAELEIGTAVSGIVAFLSVKWLLGFLQKNSFEVFGWYRIILGILMLLFFS